MRPNDQSIGWSVLMSTHPGGGEDGEGGKRQLSFLAQCTSAILLVLGSLCTYLVGVCTSCPILSGATLLITPSFSPPLSPVPVPNVATKKGPINTVDVKSWLVPPTEIFRMSSFYLTVC